MALLTIPSTPEKGTNQNYTLDVTALIALVSDAYFQDQANWSKVALLYQSSVSNQLEMITFIPDGVSTSITSSAEFSTFARNIFNVQSITIFDNQNGRYVIKASEIPSVSNYDINFSQVAVNWNIFTDGFTLGPNGGITKAGIVTDYGYCPRSTNFLSGDFEITFNANNTDLLKGWCAGVSKGLSNPETGNNQFVFYFEDSQLHVYTEGSYRVSGLPLSSGNNIFTITRVGSDIKFFMNESPVAIYSTTYIGNLYPEARVGGAITSMSVVL